MLVYVSLNCPNIPYFRTRPRRFLLSLSEFSLLSDSTTAVPPLPVRILLLSDSTTAVPPLPVRILLTFGLNDSGSSSSCPNSPYFRTQRRRFLLFLPEFSLLSDSTTAVPPLPVRILLTFGLDDG